MTPPTSPTSVSLYGHGICPYATRVAFALAERGTDPDRIEGAALALGDALTEMDGWLAESTWLAGDRPPLAEAVMIPLYVRLAGLRRLGFDSPLPASVDDHRHRCGELEGWPAVAWSDEQTDEFVGRFETHRRRARMTG